MTQWLPEWNSVTRRWMAVVIIIVGEFVTVVATGKAAVESAGGTWEGWASVLPLLGPLVVGTFLVKVLTQLMSAGGKKADAALKAANGGK